MYNWKETHLEIKTLTCHIPILVQSYILWPMFSAALEWSVPIRQITASRMIHPSSNNEQPLHHLLLFIVPSGFSEYSCLDKKIKERNIKLGWKKNLIKLSLLLVSSFSVLFKVIINRVRLFDSEQCLNEIHCLWSNTSEGSWCFSQWINKTERMQDGLEPSPAQERDRNIMDQILNTLFHIFGLSGGQ